jgi:alpha-glucosidase
MRTHAPIFRPRLLPALLAFAASACAFAAEPTTPAELPDVVASAIAAKTVELASPNGDFRVRVFTKAGDGAPAYAVDWRGKPLIVESALGLQFDKLPALTGLEVAGQTVTEHDETWKTVCGERATVRDHYKQVTVDFKEKAAPGRTIQLVLRAYDTGVAFRYRLPKQDGVERVTLPAETSEFRFPEDHACWATAMSQGHYARVPSTRLGTVERPLIVEAGPDRFVALAEAGLLNYSRTKFSRLPDGKPGVTTRIEGGVRAVLPMESPWRTIMAASSPAALLQNNDLLLNLNAPCAIEDTSWIKPGKVLREVTLTTEGAKRTADYCAAHNIAYMMFDAGWYGDEYSAKSDATKTILDPKRSKGPFDLPEILRYAEEKKVGVILYVNCIAMRRQLKDILPLYKQWGVKGVKYGFVDVGGQGATDFVNHAIRLAAENRLMVDIHDDWRPTGTQRTWPNLMTCEGIAGDEVGSRSNAQSLVHQYTRFLAGPADNTFCYFNPRVDKLANHAYQLAKSVCFFSPWQFIHWYDRPASPGDVLAPGDGRIGDEPELVFWNRLPTAWDDTRVIDGAIGKFSAIARRKGDGWWLGCMNTDEPRTLKLKLDFLTAGRKYEAVSYTHDPEVTTRTHVKITRQPVTADTELTVELGKNDGRALEIIPVKD